MLNYTLKRNKKKIIYTIIRLAIVNQMSEGSTTSYSLCFLHFNHECLFLRKEIKEQPNVLSYYPHRAYCLLRTHSKAGALSTLLGWYTVFEYGVSVCDHDGCIIFKIVTHSFFCVNGHGRRSHKSQF